MSTPIRSERIEIHKVTVRDVQKFSPLHQTEWEFYNSLPCVFSGTFEQCVEWASERELEWITSREVFGGYWRDVWDTAYMPT